MIVYVHGLKKTYVKSAIEEVGNLKMGLCKQKMVPFKEMHDVLRVFKDGVKNRILGSYEEIDL